MSQCDMCGADGPLVSAIVEGTMMSLCASCRSFGNVVAVRPTERPSERKPSQLVFESYQEVVVPNAGELIKRAREQKGMTQEQLAQALAQKQSVIHKIESGQFKLAPQQARSFERFFGIRIVEKYEDPRGVAVDVHDTRLTVGDLLKLKKKVR